MKVNELVNMMNDSRVSALKPEQLRTKLQKELEVKKYLSIKDKESLVKTIVNDSIYYEDGIYKINGIEKYINFTMLVIAAYTNLELSDDIKSDFDMLCEADLIGKVVDTFDSEYQSVLGFLQMHCDYVLASNSVSSKIGVFLDGVMNNIDNLTTVFSNKIENFSFNDLDINPDDIGKVTELLSLLK